MLTFSENKTLEIKASMRLYWALNKTDCIKNMHN